MRILKRLTIFFIVAVFSLLLFYVGYMRPRHVVPILMYHAVSTDKDDSLHVSPSNFRRQIEFLHKANYSVISLDDLVDGINNGTKFPQKTVVITFDDGFEDNFLHAFPILSKYEMPATIFIVTGYMDNKDEEDYLNWEQVRVMNDNGIDIGAHTRNNSYLPGVKAIDDLRNEIMGSREDIKKTLGIDAMYFCYPTGGFNSVVKGIVKEAGYKGACTTNRGSDRSNRDVYELNRVKITNSDCVKPLHFRAKMSGYYNLFRSLKSGG